eukprot:2323858-Rhodomonas_salina.1
MEKSSRMISLTALFSPSIAAWGLGFGVSGFEGKVKASHISTSQRITCATTNARTCPFRTSRSQKIAT